MPPTRKLPAVALVAAAASIAGAAAALAQTASCTWYADMALKQQQQNEQRKCGFTGPEWNPDKQVHLTWCATQSPDVWKAVAQKREKMLAECRR
jgi:hypothetical protein